MLEEIKTFIPEGSPYKAVLYDLMLDYPLREAKALRPALCIATCRALGGSLEGVLKSAAVLEFYHNAFLIHDDIEDNSEKRRDRPTLHRMHGVPVAINVGDAMLALALEPLLDNTRLLGLGRALRILKAVARMARESAEGQALELSWIQRGCFELEDRDYLRMVHQKTSHYTFITPMLIGGIVAGADEMSLFRLRKFATALGLAFQIQDDVLNLSANEVAYGKEILGDLWEGKHTLVLMHTLRQATALERRRATRILRKARPQENRAKHELVDTIDALARQGQLSARAKAALRSKLGAASAEKTTDDVSALLTLIKKYRSIEYAQQVAAARARRAQHSLDLISRRLTPSVHLEFLRSVAGFVVERDR